MVLIAMACGKIPHWIFDMFENAGGCCIANAMNNAIKSPLFNHCSWPKAYINLQNPMNIQHPIFDLFVCSRHPMKSRNRSPSPKPQRNLRQELASFADYVSEQSWRMRSDLGRELSKPQPSSAGALPRPPVEATAMSCLVDGGFSG